MPLVLRLTERIGLAWTRSMNCRISGGSSALHREHDHLGLALGGNEGVDHGLALGEGDAVAVRSVSG